MRSIPLETSDRASPTHYCPSQARASRIGAMPSFWCWGHSLEADWPAYFCEPLLSNAKKKHASTIGRTLK